MRIAGCNDEHILGNWLYNGGKSVCMHNNYNDILIVNVYLPVNCSINNNFFEKSQAGSCVDFI